MSSKKFNFKTLQKKYNDDDDKSHAKNYVLEFFHPLTNCTHALIQDGIVEIIQPDAMAEYLNRFPEPIKKWYKTKTTLKRIICDVFQPQIGDDFLNTAPQLFRELTSYKSFSKEIKKSVQKMLSFIKEVICGSDDNQFDYFLKWHSRLIKGQRNHSILFLKTKGQGCGKSTYSEFFTDHVVLKENFAKGDVNMLVTDNNMQLKGKSYVVFEEMPALSTKIWQTACNKLKDFCTGKYINYSEKYIKKTTEENINNYVVISNYDCLDADGRRYAVFDINTKYTDNFDYFADLRKSCYNDECGYAFYNYLWEIDTDDFLSLKLPQSARKNDYIASNLTTVELFLKFEYVLSDQSIAAKVKDVYTKYSAFCVKRGLRPETKIHFNQSMQSYGIVRRAIQGYDCYRVPIEVLKALAETKKWLHVTDTDEMDGYTMDCEDDDDDKADLLTTFKKSEDKEREFIKLLHQFSKLKKQVKTMEQACEDEDIIIPHMNNTVEIGDIDTDDEVDERKIDFYPYELPTPGMTININVGEKKKKPSKFKESVSELDDDDFDEINVHLHKH